MRWRQSERIRYLTNLHPPLTDRVQVSSRRKIAEEDTEPARNSIMAMASSDINDGAPSPIFDTTKLLERIPLDIALRQFFVIQRTSRFFKNVIGGSVKHQQRMCLSPVRQDPVMPHYSLRNDSSMMLGLSRDAPMIAPPGYTTADMSPLFGLYDRCLTAKIGLTPDRRAKDCYHWLTPETFGGGLVSLREKQTWQDAYIINPPSRRFQAKI